MCLTAACLLCSYGLDLFLLSIDEGISGYRDDSLETVKRNEQTYGIPLKVRSRQQKQPSAAVSSSSSRQQQHQPSASAVSSSKQH